MATREEREKMRTWYLNVFNQNPTTKRGGATKDYFEWLENQVTDGFIKEKQKTKVSLWETLFGRKK